MGTLGGGGDTQTVSTVIEKNWHSQVVGMQKHLTRALRPFAPAGTPLVPRPAGETFNKYF